MHRNEKIKEIISVLKQKKAVLIHGKSGVGKTALARHIFSILSIKPVFFNGIDEISELPLSRTLDGRISGTIIDNFDKTSKDNYNILIKYAFAIKEIDDIKEYTTRFPIIFICEEQGNFKFKKDIVYRTEIEPLGTQAICDILSNRFTIEESKLLDISTRCNGNMRKALGMCLGGSDLVKERLGTTDLVRKFLHSDDIDRFDILEEENVGQYGGLSYQWFISVLSRNIKGSFAEKASDYNVLSSASKLKHINSPGMINILLSSIHQNRIKRVKYPKKMIKNE